MLKKTKKAAIIVKAARTKQYTAQAAIIAKIWFFCCDAYKIVILVHILAVAASWRLVFVMMLLVLTPTTQPFGEEGFNEFLEKRKR